MYDTDATEADLEHTQRVSIWSLLTFGIAIILHSIIDGLAIGVFDEVSLMAILSVSVIIHKIPVSCTIGQSFLKNNQKLC